MKRLFSSKVLFDAIAFAFVFVCLTSFIETIACLRQAPGECEESWFLYLAQNRVCENYSFVPLYFNSLPHCILQYLPCRISLLIVKFLTSVAFVLSLIRYSKKELGINISSGRCLCLYLLPTISASSQSVCQADYGMTSLALILLVISSVLWSLTNGGVVHNVCAAVAGFLAFQFVMIRPPLGLLALCVFVVFFVHGFSLARSYALGALLGLVFFAFCITTPSEFITILKGFLVSSASTTDGHGVKLLVTSSMHIFNYIVPCIVFGFFLHFMESVRFRLPLIKCGLYAIVFVFLTLETFRALRSGMNFWAGRRVGVMCLFVLFYYCVAKNLSKFELKQSSMLGLLAAVPLILGIGTTTPFDCEVGGYLLFVLVFIGIVLAENTDRIVLLIALIVLVTYQGLMIVHLNCPKWSNGQRFVDSCESLTDTNLVATPEFCEYLRQLDGVTRNRPYVLGGPTQWEIVQLLHKTPLNTSFRLPSDRIFDEIRRIRPPVDKFFLLGDKHTKFDAAEITNLCHEVNASQCTQIKLKGDKSVWVFN